MAYANFKQTFWSKHIQQELHKKLILAEGCDAKFTGEAKFGNKVKVLGVGTPTIGDYNGTSIGTPETVADSSVFIDIDQRKYFNFMVDDVDKAQSTPGLMEALMDEATYALAKSIDKYVAGRAIDAGAFSSSTQINSAAAAKTAIDAGITSLLEDDVEAKDITIEIPPFVYQYMKDKYIDVDTNNSEMLKKGIMGWYDGAKVRLTNNLYSDGTDLYCMLRTKRAIALVKQINDTEAFRPETLFSDAIKGLAVFGAKVVRPKEIYVIKAHK
jgi:hypothetical protein